MTRPYTEGCGAAMLATRSSGQQSHHLLNTASLRAEQLPGDTGIANQAQ